MSDEQQPNSAVGAAWDAATDWLSSAGQALAEAADATGDAISGAIDTAGNTIGGAMESYGKMQIQQAQIQQAAAKAELEAIQRAAQATKKAFHTGMKTYGEAQRRGAQYRAEAARQQVEAIKYGAKTAENAAAIAVADVLVATVKAHSSVEQCLRDNLKKPGGNPGDGEYMGKGCPKTSKEFPAEGTKPKGCANCGKQFPKIIYTNGINTPPEAACATMHKIADSRCAEVFGIYNATDGALADFVNANESIEGRRDDPAAMRLSKTIRDFAARDEPLTLYAHSEGGLNSIVGLRDAYDKMKRDESMAYADAAMRNITVYSFGTATTGWPDGPRYTQYTNWNDPVPHVIKQVQVFSGESPKWLQNVLGQDLPWPNETRDRNLHLPTPKPAPHHFHHPFTNPIDAHSMDNLYLPKLNSVDPVLKGPDGSCCG